MYFIYTPDHNSVLNAVYCFCVAYLKLENVFVKRYAPNQMPDPKGEWSLLENSNGNNSELVSQSTYDLQSSDKDASPEVHYFSKFQMLKFSKGHNS